MKAYKLLLIVLPFLISCGSKSSDNQDEPSVNENEIVVTNEQFNTMGMEFGNPSKHTFIKTITVSGIVDPKSNGYAVVSSPVQGFVRSIIVAIGSKVKRGDALFTMDGPEIVDLQQSYVEYYNQHKVASENYKRVKQLANNDIASQKELQLAESDLNILSAKVESLKAKLKMLNVDTKKLQEGNLLPYVTMVSPIDGVVSSSSLIIGMTVSSQENIVEIINPDMFRVKLFVFAEDIAKVKMGQKVTVKLPSSNDTLVAKVSNIGLEINSDTKAVTCLADINVGTNENLVNGMQISANIEVDRYTAYALPLEAIHEKGNRHVVLVKNAENASGITLNLKPVNVGLSDKEFTQILDSTITNVLIKGGYELIMD